ncbi:MAG: hypothetical protein K2G17_02130, partial [Duncaniella sp.]|nr:hypothetical protein [Duncaniella sp.]
LWYLGPMMAENRVKRDENRVKSDVNRKNSLSLNQNNPDITNDFHALHPYYCTLDRWFHIVRSGTADGAL